MEKIYLPKDWVCNGSELKPKNGGSRETWMLPFANFENRNR